MMSGRSHSLEEARRLVHAYDELGGTMLTSLPGFASHGGWEYALQLATIGLTAKACCTTRAIVLLLHHELPGEAQVLQRVLVELAVTALAIGREPKTRAPLYVDYRHIAKHTWWERAKKNVALRRAVFDEDPRQAGALRANYDTHKAVYATRKGRVRAKWHKESSSQLAREVNLDDLWDAVYGIDSALVHSGPDCLPLYVREPRPRQLHIGPLTGETRTMRVLLDVTTCMQRVLDHFLEVFPSAGECSQLEQLSRRRDVLFSRDAL